MEKNFDPFIQHVQIADTFIFFNTFVIFFVQGEICLCINNHLDPSSHEVHG
jgi:hypothetical protein